MHSLLESYLAEVRAKLCALPAARREEELREMRQHLLDAVRVNREQGQTEVEAAANALAEFGTSAEASESVLWAWRRGKVMDQRNFLGGAVCTMVLSYLLPRMLEPGLVPLGFLDLIHPFGLHGFVVLSNAVHALAGGISGLVFGRRAMAGTALAVAIWYGIPIIRVLSGSEWVRSPAEWAFEYPSFALLAIIAAWIMSRWRKAHIKRPAAVWSD